MCPVCDHELLGAFCPVCKAVRNDGWTLPEGVYLNKSHSGQELNCDFHDHDRKTVIMNESHPEGEKECSYHNPEHYDELGGDLEGIFTKEFRRLRSAAKTGKSGAFFRRFRFWK